MIPLELSEPALIKDNSRARLRLLWRYCHLGVLDVTSGSDLFDSLDTQMPLDAFARIYNASCTGFWLRRPAELRRIVAASGPATPSMSSMFTRMKEHIGDNQIGR